MDEITRWQKRKARTRELLKQCTMELLLEKNYTDLTIQDITDRADLARGTFYVHFSDKEDITWTLLREGIDALGQEVLSEYTEESYPRRKYLSLMRMFEFAQQNRDLLRVMLGDKGHPAFTKRIQDYLCVFLERGLVDGVFQAAVVTDIPMKFAAQFMTGAMVRVMLWSIEDDVDYTPAQMAKYFYEVIYREPMPENI